jgi:hypothetical protein
VNIRECDDGKILIICRAGCGALEILESLGLGWDALMPEQTGSSGRVDHRMKKIRAAFPAGDILRALESETLFLYMCASAMKSGRGITEADNERLAVTVQRIGAIRN